MTDESTVDLNGPGPDHTVVSVVVYLGPPRDEDHFANAGEQPADEEAPE